MSATEARTIGHYRLRSLIGRGGTSEVYTAAHLVLGDVVAIKLLRAELADDAAQAIALVDEGTKVRAIDHPNVVRVLDAGIDPASRSCYLVMEHVAGEPLSARLRRDGALPEVEVRRIGAAIADGVAAAHARGIIHRDLKPANVMLDGGRPKIVDFGIARVLGSRSAVTTGRAVGTLAYMAPEQLASGMLAPCTDIWALGVILFEAATGRLPFEAFHDGRCPQLFDAPARVATLAPVSPAFDALIARCLERDPARRPASAAALARLLRGEPEAEPEAEPERVTADVGPLPGRFALPPAAPRRAEDRLTVDAGPPPYRTAPPARDLQTPASAPPWQRRRAMLVSFALAGAATVGAFALAATGPRTRAPDGGAAAASRPAPAAPAVIEPPVPATPAADAEAAAARALPPARVAAPALVELRSTPSGAHVVVDGTPRGVTPVRLELALPAEVELHRRGYFTSRVRVDRSGTLAVTLARRTERTERTERTAPPTTKPTVRMKSPPRETLD